MLEHLTAGTSLPLAGPHVPNFIISFLACYAIQAATHRLGPTVIGEKWNSYPERTRRSFATRVNCQYANHFSRSQEWWGGTASEEARADVWSDDTRRHGFCLGYTSFTSRYTQVGSCFWIWLWLGTIRSYFSRVSTEFQWPFHSDEWPSSTSCEEQLSWRSLRYFLWDTIDSIRNSTIAFVIHGLACLGVFTFSFVSHLHSPGSQVALRRSSGHILVGAEADISSDLSWWVMDPLFYSGNYRLLSSISIGSWYVKLVYDISSLISLSSKADTFSRKN